mgnify:CR=1 FL=1
MTSLISPASCVTLLLLPNAVSVYVMLEVPVLDVALRLTVCVVGQMAEDMVAVPPHVEPPVPVFDFVAEKELWCV